jgi:hypothetical protein
MSTCALPARLCISRRAYCVVLRTSARLCVLRCWLQQEHELVVGGLYEYAQDLGRELAGVSGDCV